MAKARDIVPASLIVDASPDRVHIQLRLDLRFSSLSSRAQIALAALGLLALLAVPYGMLLYLAALLGTGHSLAATLLTVCCALLWMLALLFQRTPVARRWFMTRHMPSLTLTPRRLTVRDHRGELQIPLAEIQGLRMGSEMNPRAQRTLIADRAEGPIVLAEGVNSEESRYLIDLIGHHSQTLRESLRAAGEDVDTAASAPQAITQMTARNRS